MFKDGTGKKLSFKKDRKVKGAKLISNNTNDFGESDDKQVELIEVSHDESIEDDNEFNIVTVNHNNDSDYVVTSNRSADPED